MPFVWTVSRSICGPLSSSTAKDLWLVIGQLGTLHDAPYPVVVAQHQATAGCAAVVDGLDWQSKL